MVCSHCGGPVNADDTFCTACGTPIARQSGTPPAAAYSAPVILCGLCGSRINPGFSVCPSCGAVYRSQGGCLVPLLVLLAIVAILVGVGLLINGQVSGLWLLAVGGFLIWLAVKAPPPKGVWWKRI